MIGFVAENKTKQIMPIGWAHSNTAITLLQQPCMILKYASVYQLKFCTHPNTLLLLLKLYCTVCTSFSPSPLKSQRASEHTLSPVTCGIIGRDPHK